MLSETPGNGRMLQLREDSLECAEGLSVEFAKFVIKKIAMYGICINMYCIPKSTKPLSAFLIISYMYDKKNERFWRI